MADVSANTTAHDRSARLLIQGYTPGKDMAANENERALAHYKAAKDSEDTPGEAGKKIAESVEDNYGTDTAEVPAAK